MLYTNHSRSFKENRYVYPVLSRRSKGISVGINLNPDKVCNFNCVYCQVDRNVATNIKRSEIDRIQYNAEYNAQVELNSGSEGDYSTFIHNIGCELNATIKLIQTGEIFTTPPFDKTPDALRHLSDIAISGDGEPTLYPHFYEVVEEIIKVLGHFPYFHENIENMESVPIVLITNSTGLNRPKVQDAIDLIYKNNGEVWLKLDAGSEDFHKKVSGSDVPLRVIIQNIISVSIRHRVVIQSCFFRIDNSPFPVREIGGYCLRIKEIVESGGNIRLIQIYTVARPPREDYVFPLSQDELTYIAGRVQEITGLPAETYT